MARKRDSSPKIIKEIADNRAISRDLGSAKKKVTGVDGSLGNPNTLPLDAQLTPLNLPSANEVVSMVSVTSVADLLLVPNTPNNDQYTPDLDFPSGGSRSDLSQRDTPTDRYTTRVLRGNAPVYIAMYNTEAQIGMSQLANVVAWALM